VKSKISKTWIGWIGIYWVAVSCLPGGAEGSSQGVRKLFRFALISMLVGCYSKTNRSDSTSPDRHYVVRIIERSDRAIDRRFKVVLRDNWKKAETLIYESPDEGVPGSERFLWATNSSAFLLIGRNFVVKTNAPFTYVDSDSV
jgi:hypothetical protein